MVEVGKEVLVDLLQQVEKATGPDVGIDVAIYNALRPPSIEDLRAMHEAGDVSGYWYWMGHRPLTSSIDAASALVERVLPGWWWKVGTCCVSDDACIAPDFNSPIHGERLHREFGPIVSGSEIDAGYDVDRRPPGNVPLALLESLLRALLAQAEKEAG